MVQHWYWLAIPALLVVLIIAGRRLLQPRDMFAALGDVNGKHIGPVIRKLGDPNKVLDRPDGTEMRWISTASFRPSQLTLHVDTEGYVVKQEHKAK